MYGLILNNKIKSTIKSGLDVSVNNFTGEIKMVLGNVIEQTMDKMWPAIVSDLRASFVEEQRVEAEKKQKELEAENAKRKESGDKGSESDSASDGSDGDANSNT